jgi:hypothetical protein
MKMRECLANGCRLLAYEGRLLCETCWSLVPQALKDALYAAYTSGQNDGLAEPSQAWIDLAKRVVASAERNRQEVLAGSHAPACRPRACVCGGN